MSCSLSMRLWSRSTAARCRTLRVETGIPPMYIGWPIVIAWKGLGPMASVAIEIHDEEAWAAMPEVQKQDYISTAMTLGKVEVHKRWPIATLTRLNGRDRVPQWTEFFNE